ncbi:hypothetical protein Xen7305DRAFT_00037390 [Xenococcus sp. PCC 7305]|nr:hypothetical protein Xen7305DRAFT_00037390 [Xenococcus sp. PCC 7305]
MTNHKIILGFLWFVNMATLDRYGYNIIDFSDGECL